MGVVVARLVFLAFVGLTGFIIYNALYLQDVRNVAVLPTTGPRAAASPAIPRPVATKPPEPPKVSAVSTDLPPLQGQEAPTQLVTAIQRELAARGYSGGPADGKLRDETRRAISSFEKDNGLPVTGAPSDALLRHILLGEAAAPAVSTGSLAGAAGGTAAKPSSTIAPDPTIKQVQQILADLGYAPGPIDGSMGSGTERAVGAFQRDRKIASTGHITPELLREIKRVTGRDLANGASPH
jgi:peptidoglycan hydrolase-like protein with peptidoglycan-binding domain